LGREEMHIGSGGKPQRKRLLGRRRHRWEDDIKLDIQEMECKHGLDRSNTG